MGKKGNDGLTELGPVRQGLSLMTTWTGLRGKDDQTAQESPSGAPKEGKKTKGQEEEDDRRIRFTIGVAGKRMTKEDFLKEMQSLDPKSRAKVVNESNAPAEMKDLARKDARQNLGGSSRLYAVKDPEMRTSRKEAAQVGAKTAKERDTGVRDEEIDSRESADEAAVERKREESADAVTAGKRREEAMREVSSDESLATKQTASGLASLNLGRIETPSTQVPETVAERIRENVFRGLDEETSPHRLPQPAERVKETPAERRRREAMSALSSAAEIVRAMSPTGETPAEKRRREAALGVGGDVVEEDSDDDNTERVPQARRRPGIRFAEEPIRGRK